MVTLLKLVNARNLKTQKLENLKTQCWNTGIVRDENIELD